MEKSSIKVIKGSKDLKEIIDIFRYKRTMGLNDSDFSNPLLILGESGIGKSQIIEQFSKEKKMLFVKFDLSNVDSTTFNGLMITMKEDKSVIHYHTIPSFIKRLELAAKKGKEVLILLDEINRTSFETRNAVFKLVINNEWGIDSKKLDSKVYIIAAMNPNSEEYGDTEELDGAFNNRFVKILFQPTLEDWLIYAKEKEVHSLIIELLEENEEFFEFGTFGENKKGLDPRNWEDLSYALKAIEDNCFDEKLILDMFEMYIPFQFEKIKFFIKNRKNYLSVYSINKEITTSKNLKDYIKSELKPKYHKISMPRKIELLKTALNYIYIKIIDIKTLYYIILETPSEIRQTVFFKLTENLTPKNKKIISLLEDLDKKFNMELFKLLRV